MRHIVSLTIATLAVVLYSTTTANAGFMAQLTGITPSGVNFSYNYNLVFSTQDDAERLEAGNGALTPGAVDSQDFITLYDVGFSGPGDGMNFISATAGADFSVQLQNAGVDAAQTVPFDNPFLTNVTFRYTGADLTADTVFPGFSIVVNNNDGVSLKPYTSQRTDNAGDENNMKISEIGTAAVPVTNVIPEPASWALAAMGLLGLFFGRKKLRRQSAC
jgi:MYXO-CTERM domain-containing protein